MLHKGEYNLSTPTTPKQSLCPLPKLDININYKQGFVNAKV